MKHCRVPDTTVYDPYNVETTNNILHLERINFEGDLKNFDDKYNQFYQSVSQNIMTYNSLLTNLFVII